MAEKSGGRSFYYDSSGCKESSFAFEPKEAPIWLFLSSAEEEAGTEQAPLPASGCGAPCAQPLEWALSLNPQHEGEAWVAVLTLLHTGGCWPLQPMPFPPPCTWSVRRPS